MAVEPPAIVVLEAPGRDFLQGKTFENHLAACFDRLDDHRLNGCGFSAQERFLRGDPADLLQQSDFSHPPARQEWLRPGGPDEHRPDGYDRELQESRDSRDAVLNKHAAFSSNTNARKPDVG